MAAMTPAQQLAEVKRKAAMGIALTSATPEKQSVYDATRADANKEIMRKAQAGEALTSNASAYNNEMYAGLAAAKANSMGNANTSKSLIDGLAEARRNQTIAALDKSRNAALSNLGAEKSAIQPKYYDARNQAAAGSQQQARNFAEFMAARGGTSSGANAQAELSRGMTLQGNLGSLGRQEAADYSDIERRTSDLQNAYQSDIAAATAGMEADRMQASLTDYYNQQQRELEIAQLMGTYNGQKTIGGRTLDQNILDSNRNYDRGVLESDRAFTYTQGRDKVADAQWQEEFDRIKEQDGIQNALAWASHNLNVRQENRVAANQSSGGSGGSGGSGPSKESTIQDINLPRSASSMETYIINNLPGGKNVFGPPSPNQLTLIESMILDNPNLSEADMVKLYKKFGIPLPE